MKNILFLIKNEIKKFLTLKRWLIAVGIFIALLLVLAISYNKETKENWKDYVNEEITKSQNLIDEYSLDEENIVLIEYESNRLNLLKYRLEHNISPYETILQFVYDSFTFDTVLILLVVITTIFIISNEYTNNTILILLTSGEKRRNILLSKLIVSIIYILAILFIYLILAFIIGTIFFSKNGLGSIYLVMDNSTIIQKSLLIEIINDLIVTFIRIITYTTMAFFLTTIIKNNALSIIVMLVILFFGGSIISLLSLNQKWSFLIVFCSLENLGNTLSDFINWSSNIFKQSIICCLIYSVLFIIGSFIVFIKKPLLKKHL